MSLSKIVLQLARNPGLPAGDASQGYTLVAPLTSEGQIDLDAWRAHRAECRVVRFSPDPDEVAFAKKILEAMPDGTGAVMIDGKMQDDATWKQAKVIVDLARLGDDRSLGGLRGGGRQGQREPEEQGSEGGDTTGATARQASQCAHEETRGREVGRMGNHRGERGRLWVVRHGWGCVGDAGRARW